MAKALMPKAIKQQADFERKIKRMDQELRKKVLRHKIINSGYAFACFNSFSAIHTLDEALMPKRKFGIC